MAKVILIRHGQTAMNVERIIAGRGSNPGLTEEGIAQAHQAGKLLQEEFGLNIHTLVSSGMLRTNQTAAILNQHLNIDKIHYDVALQEKDYGSFEGKSMIEFIPIIQALDNYEPVPGGESDLMFKTRVTEALCKYFALPDSLYLLAVTHGHLNRIAMREFFNQEKHFNNCEFVMIDPEQIGDLAGKCGWGIEL